MLGPRFVLQYCMSFLVLQASRWGERGWLLLPLLCSECRVAVIVFRLFLTVLWVGL